MKLLLITLLSLSLKAFGDELIAIEDGVHKVVNVLHQAHIKDHALGDMKLGTIAP